MSVRLRVFSGILVAIFVLCSLAVAMSFLVFLTSVNLILDIPLTAHIGQIAARYFSIGGILLVILTGVGAMWAIAVLIRNVTKPLSKLKKAASEIRDGNLNYELIISGNDEFTELAESFEQMRIRLKNSLMLREVYENERKAMMAYIAHDLKTPITSISGYAEGILDGVASSPEKINEYAAIIHNKAKSLLSLSEDLALLSNLENDAMPLQKQKADLALLIEEITAEYFRDKSSVKLELALEAELIVAVDKEKLTRVMINIYQNSQKYKKPEQNCPEIQVKLKRQGEDALLTLSDNGIVVAQSDLPRLFDRFYRADESRGKSDGSGLGLAIARQLILLHGGKIWITRNPTGGLAINIALKIA